MNKRQLHHLWTNVRPIRPWYFLIAALVSLLVCVYGLRTNNLQMVKLREAVYQADQNNGDIQGSLTALQRYVTSHMNTELSAGSNAVYPPIQLKYTFERLQDQAAQASSNEQVYSDAQTYCEQTNPQGISGRYRLTCIQDYVTSHGAKAPAIIPDNLYKFDFISPVWSPDLAGWGAVATVLFIMLALGFWIIDLWFKRRLHRKAENI